MTHTLSFETLRILYQAPYLNDKYCVTIFYIIYNSIKKIKHIEIRNQNINYKQVINSLF